MFSLCLHNKQKFNNTSSIRLTNTLIEYEIRMITYLSFRVIINFIILGFISSIGPCSRQPFNHFLWTICIMISISFLSHLILFFQPNTVIFSLLCFFGFYVIAVAWFSSGNQSQHWMRQERKRNEKKNPARNVLRPRRQIWCVARFHNTRLRVCFVLQH